MKNLRPVAAALACVGLVACAQASGDVRPSYIPATTYASYSCDQLLPMMLDVQNKVMVVSGQQDYKRKVDQSATGVGIVLFWPALIAMPLTADHKQELSQLKGQYEAIGRAMEIRQCQMASAGNVAAVQPAPPAAQSSQPSNTSAATTAPTRTIPATSPSSSPFGPPRP